MLEYFALTSIVHSFIFFSFVHFNYVLSGVMRMYYLSDFHLLILWHIFKSVKACLGKSFD